MAGKEELLHRSPWFEEYVGPSRCGSRDCLNEASWHFIPPGGPNSYHCKYCSLRIYDNEVNKPFELKRRNPPLPGTITNAPVKEPELSSWQTCLTPEHLDNRLADIASILSVGFVMMAKLKLAELAMTAKKPYDGFIDSAMEDLGILTSEGGT